MTMEALCDHAQVRNLLVIICRVVPRLLLALYLTVGIPTTLHDASMPSTRDENAHDSPLPLRLAFVDSTSETTQAVLARHIRDLDGLIGDWLVANPDGTLMEQEEPDDPGNNIEAALRVARLRQMQILAMVSEKDGVPRSFTRLSEPAFRTKI